MKASALIDELEKFIHIYGDLSVRQYGYYASSNGNITRLRMNYETIPVTLPNAIEPIRENCFLIDPPQCP